MNEANSAGMGERVRERQGVREKNTAVSQRSLPVYVLSSSRERTIGFKVLTILQNMLNLII
jgi:hypothetical protein